MRATSIEFRLRMVVNAIIIILGFTAPWIESWGIGKRISTLEWLALELSRHANVSFAVATPVVIVLSALIAAKGAFLRVWGTAYLGPTTVQSAQMKAGTVMADGPYRFVRNPLYLGLLCMVAAMAFLMPPTGALFAITLIAIFILRLTLGEEAFLAAKIGEPYKNYLRAVPRFIPRLRFPLPSAGAKPHWLRAALAEILPIGVFVTLAFVSWTYDSEMAGRAILIAFGLSLVVRALMPNVPPDSEPSQ